MTVMVVVSTGFAWVVSRMRVPLGLVDESVAELIVSGLTGYAIFQSGLNESLYAVPGRLIIYAIVFTPVSNCPKSV